MENFIIIIRIIELMLYIYLATAVFYVFIFSIAGKFKIVKHKPNLNESRKFALLIPAYKEDNVIVNVVQQALKQSYPQNLYDVVVIADSLKPDTLNQLKKLPIRLIEVSFEKSTKSKALNKGMDIIGDNYDVALVIDADNIMEYDFINKINNAFNNNCKVVQGHRTAKNINTNFAVLDAVSEEINNHIFRKGHRVLGLSAALIGSGMAFDYSMFKKMMKKVKAVGGFDKELELNLLKNRIKIEYLEEAVIFDEKVSKPKTFSNQRKRWLSAQFVYFKKYFLSGIYHLFTKGNIDFFDKVYQMALPPRILLLGILIIVTIVNYLFLTIYQQTEIAFLYFNTANWMILLILTIVSFLLATPIKYYNLNTLKAVLTLPKVFFIMFLVLFKLKNANKKFIHTIHGNP
ncbi:MAG: glycosyltransferase family 2 protein [Bacteroidales bacterium]|nr:glycosyltransferase family 2 protein [Bacteroidales bacterium]